MSALQGLQSIDDGGAFAWGKAGFARLSPSWEALPGDSRHGPK
jgi:hypothetical protein